jgi:hypothetical protein
LRKILSRGVKMDVRCKKFIALFLVFSLVMLSTNLYVKDRRVEAKDQKALASLD